MMRRSAVSRLSETIRVNTESLSPSPMQLLLIEDDPTLQTSLRRTLERRGMRVRLCADGLLALAQWREQVPDVVLLDLSLPGLDGLEVLAQARKSGLLTPVLILTARGTVGDRVIGLNTGADDYLAKPFDLDELEARIRALHRRAAGASADDDSGDSPACGQLRLDRASGAIHHGLKVLDLSPREGRLLRALLQRPGRAVAKEQLFEIVFPGESEVHYEAIEVVAYRLRKKLTATGTTLVTLRGLGYLLKVQA